MPRLIMFGVCQKAIVDRDQGGVSMISLMSVFQLRTVAGLPSAPDLVIPLAWATVASWFREDDDAEHEFQPRIDVVWPNGEVAVEIPGSPFRMGHPAVQSVTNQIGLPVGQQGLYSMRIYLRR